MQLADGAAVPFDSLIVATGSTHHYFGHDEWAELAPGLKTIEDATEIRRRVLSAFEQAERETDPAARARLLTFVVVGGGPTGVEMAGAISELGPHTLRVRLPPIDPADAPGHPGRGAERGCSAAFHEKLSREGARQRSRRWAIEVQLDCHVTDDRSRTTSLVKPDGGKAEPTRIETETVVWAAGVKAIAARQADRRRGRRGARPTGPGGCR